MRSINSVNIYTIWKGMLTDWVFTSQIFKKFSQICRNLFALLFWNAIVLSIDDNNRISYQKVTTNMGDSGITRFQFNVIYNATKNYQNREICTIIDTNHYIFNKDIQVNNKKIRKYLQCNKNKDMRNSWETKFINDSHIFEKMWNIIPDCTSEPKLILLQWKLLHNYMYLPHKQISESNRCWKWQKLYKLQCWRYN